VLRALEEVVVSLNQIGRIELYDGRDMHQAEWDYLSVDGDGALSRLGEARQVLLAAAGRVVGAAVVQEWLDGVLYWADRHPKEEVRLSSTECMMVLRALNEVVVSLGQLRAKHAAGWDMRQMQWDYFAPPSYLTGDRADDDSEGAGVRLAMAKEVLTVAIGRTIAEKVATRWCDDMAYWEDMHPGEFGISDWEEPPIVNSSDEANPEMWLSEAECKTVLRTLDEVVVSLEQFSAMQADGQDMHSAQCEYFNSPGGNGLIGDGAAVRLSEARTVFTVAAERTFGDDVVQSWCDDVLYWTDLHPGE
jgi:hypothetical protein